MRRCLAVEHVGSNFENQILQVRHVLQHIIQENVARIVHVRSRIRHIQNHMRRELLVVDAVHDTRTTHRDNIHRILHRPEVFHLLAEYVNVVFSRFPVVYARAIEVQEATRVRRTVPLLPQARMPEFIAFCKRHIRAVFRIDIHNLDMRAVRIDKDRHEALARPFAVIEGVARGSSHAMHELSGAVRNEDAFMRLVLASDKIATRLASKIQERNTLAPVFREARVAGLLTRIPNGINEFPNIPGFCDTCAQLARARHRESSIYRNAVMVRAVKEFFRSAELPASKGDFPSGHLFEIGVFGVVACVGNVYDYGIAGASHKPPRNRRLFHIEFQGSLVRSIQATHVHLRLSVDAFDTGAVGHPIAIRRDFRMVRIHAVIEFVCYGECAGIVEIDEIASHIVTENQLELVRARFFTQGRRPRYGCHPARIGFSGAVHPRRVRNGTERKPEADVALLCRGRHHVDIAPVERSYRHAVVAEAAALHDTFSDSTPIRSADKVRNDGIAEITEPIIHPLHQVSDHIAKVYPVRRLGAPELPAVSGILGSPGLDVTPPLRRGKHPFRFRRQAVSFHLGMERKAFQIGAMSTVIEYSLLVRVGSIKTFLLAPRISQEDRIIVRHVSNREFFVGAFDLVFHQLIIFTTGHLAAPNREIVCKLDLHGGLFILFRFRVIRPKDSGSTFREDAHHTFQRIRLTLDEAVRIDIGIA